MDVEEGDRLMLHAVKQAGGESVLVKKIKIKLKWLCRTPI